MATVAHGSRSAEIHKQLDHPVVDGDGHWLESVPVFHDYVKATGGQRMLDEYVKTEDGADRWFQTPPEERARHRMGRPNYWFGPGNTLDRATSMIPRLMYERLQDFGIDFAIIYPTLGLGGFQGPTACRAPACRATCAAAASAPITRWPPICFATMPTA
jgi:hypothetical protein